MSKKMEKKEFKFSVITPIYMVEEYLEKTIESVVKQTIGFEKNIQLILVNDGSPDNSGKICKKYKEKYPDNIVYIEKDNGGVSSARNEGFKYAKGKYVNFLDSDDIWDTKAFKFVYKFFEKYYNDIDVVACRINQFDAVSRLHVLDYKFDNGTTIVRGTTYWFKCEPIAWNVLSNSNGEYYILSSVLLDAHRYNASWSGTDSNGRYANNYEYSEIRAWLNDEFYNSAFVLGNSNIQLTNVDNSVATTNSSSNPYACNNTQDKVFLPSYQDYINSSYGFFASYDSTSTRYCKTTDWARATGAFYITSSNLLYNGYYWTRSPSGPYSDYEWKVGIDGYLSTNSVSYPHYSVRPSLSIKIA